MTMHLYEIADQYKFLLEDKELTDEETQIALSEIKGQFQDKVENIGKFYLSLQAEIKAIEEEEERLASRRQALEHKGNWLKQYLLQEMTVAEIDKVKRNVLTVSVRTNPPSVKVIDEEAIPKDFRRIIPETWQPDRKQIIDHFKATGEVITGVEMITDKKSVVIK